MALTLIEAAKAAANQGLAMQAGVMATFAQAHPLVAAMPWQTISGNAFSYTREDTLPPVGFRAINAAFTPSTGALDQRKEALMAAGGELDVDNFLVSTMGEGVRAAHIAQKVKALSHYIGAKLITGDNASDPKEFDGFQVRCDQTGNILEADASATDGGDPLSLIQLDALIHAVTDPSALVMGQGMLRRLTQAARSTTVGGFLTFGVNEFGRQLASYNGLPILVVDGNPIANDVLGFNEVASTGSTATATSIYCVSFGTMGLTGLQSGPMQVKDLGEIDSTPARRTRIEWNIGLADIGRYSIARLRGISNAAVVV